MAGYNGTSTMLREQYKYQVTINAFITFLKVFVFCFLFIKLQLFISLLFFIFLSLQYKFNTYIFFSFQCDKIRQERDEAVRKLEEFQKST